MRHQLRFAGGLLLVLIALVPGAAGAQGGPPAGPPTGSPRGMRPDDPRRDALERRFQQRLEAIVKERLELTDDQHGRLREVASRTEEARRTLRREEFTVRMAMRRELLAGSKANEARVAELLDSMPVLERRRLDLLEQEQRELAKFLTPLQRARYFALQDELRRGMQELLWRRLSGADSAGAPGGGRSMRRKPPR
jgi:Spy/CpxP family protein refolding chaperone